MGLADALNVKGKLAALRAQEQGEAPVELSEARTPKSYGVYERSAIDIARLVAPEAADWKPDHFQVGDEYCRTLFVHAFPPAVEDNWLAPILRFHHAIDVALYIQPFDVRSFLHKQRHQVAIDEAALTRDTESGIIPNAKKQQRLRDSYQLIEAIEEDVTLPFQVMLLMTIRARSVKELDRITEDLERAMTSLKTRKCGYRHKQGFETTLPLFDNQLGDFQCLHTIHTQGLMASFPFSSSDMTHERGVLVGVSQFTQSPIIINRFMQPEIESANTAIFGKTGSGKSYFAKEEMLHWSYQGTPVIVLDPSGEYARVCEGVGGVNININADSGDRINPLDFSYAVCPSRNALREKITYLVELFGVLVRGDRNEGLIYDAVSKKMVSNALQEVFRRYQYNVADVASQQRATSERMPTMSEVHLMLQRIARTDRDPETQKRLQPLIAALDRYVGDGDLAPLFDNRTTVNARSHFINFNYHGLQREYLPMAMHLVLEFLRTSLFTDEQRESGINRLLYVDEAQILMEYPETAHFLEYAVRTCRKYGLGLTVMTQNVGVFAADAAGNPNKVGQAIMGGCPIKILLSQEPTEAEAVVSSFHLTEGELSRLLSSRHGEGLVIVNRESTWFSSIGMASPLEHAMLTTTTTERAQIAASEHQAALAAAGYDVEFEDEERFRDAAELPPGSRGALPPARDEAPPASPFGEDPFASPDTPQNPFE
jgi:hypothetical protein